MSNSKKLTYSFPSIIDDPRLVNIDSAALRAVNSRPPLFEYLLKIWGRRHFVRAEAKARAYSDSRDYLLGKAWLIFQPVFEVMLYGLLFGVLLQTSRGIDNFLGYLVLGVTFFNYLQRLANSGVGLIKQSRGMIRSFSFPCATLVISHSLRRFYDGIPSILIGYLFALITARESLSWTPVLIIPLFFMLHLFGTGLMFFVAKLSAFIPDIKVIVNLFSRVWFYISGVFFSLDRFAHVPVIMDLMIWNPAYQFLTAIRAVVIYSEIPSAKAWVTIFLISLGTFVGGLVYFWFSEDKYVNID